MRTEIAGELALVTGAGSGIGQAIACRIAELGAEVIIVGRTASRLDETAGRIREAGGSCETIVCDLTDVAAVEQMMADIAERHGRLDIVVNNAGLALNKPFAETSVEEFDAIMATNVRAPFIILRAALPLLRASGKGEIINIGSTSAHAGYPDQSIYTASKHALLGMSKSLANEEYERGVRVHVISPGGVLTDMVRIARPDLGDTPMITPDDMADVAEYMLCHRTDAVIDEIRLHRSGKEPFA